LREYDRGPIRRFFGGAEMTPEDTGTRIRVFVEMTPRYVLFAPALRYGLIPIVLRRTMRLYEGFGRYLTGKGRTAFPPLAARRTRADTGRLDALVAQLRQSGAAEAPVERLRELLAEAPDEDVAGMRPLELADTWGLDRAQTLEMFLRATVTGLLEVRWELLCPSCRGVKAEANQLRELAATGHCSACNLQFTSRIDEAIEARFYPKPAVRPLDFGAYCVGSPMSTPHRIAQLTLPPGGRHELQVSLAPGTYVFRSPQSQGDLRLIADPTGGSSFVGVRIESAIVVPDQARVGAGPVTIRLFNATTHNLTCSLSDDRYADKATTPGRLMTFPAFRELFSSEALAPGVELAITRVGLLFTDLVGSTALYERAGDARAFRVVGDHFALLREALEQSGGTLVKTIGDAVMGAFPDGRTALKAGIHIQMRIRELDTRGLGDAARLVRVGVHSGPCLAVTLNDRLDYFGTAANLTSRAEHEAQGGEVVVTETAYEEGRDLVEAAGLAARPFDVQPKGFSAPVRMYRIDVAGARSAGEAAAPVEAAPSGSGID
jgi:class 3 adenylate cyclase